MALQLRLSTRAQLDIEELLAWTRREFGERKYQEYRELIRTALVDIAKNPDLARARPELHPQARTFHIGRGSRRARHLLLFRIGRDGVVEVGRLLHDAMDLASHADEAFE